MLKKTGYIILASLLIISTMGFVVSRHYCNNELISVSVDFPADNCCDEENADCCSNENQTFVLEVDYTQPYISIPSIVQLHLFNVVYLAVINEYAGSYASTSFLSDPAPPYGMYPLLAKIQSYLL